MDLFRIFPRYPVKKLKGFINTFPPSKSQLSLIDVSLSGLQISGNDIVDFENINELDITLGSQKFKIKVVCVWMDIDHDKQSSKAGFFIKFDKMETFNKWLTFIKALHMLQKKKQN